jgi:predicted phosphoribosyltransferase
MQEFADLADGGRRLIPYVQAALGDTNPRDVVVVAIIPNGVPAAKALAAHLSAELLPLVVARPLADDGSGRITPVVQPQEGLEGRLAGKTVVVVDDAVETGTVTTTVGSFLKGMSGRLVLAVPVCPRDVSSGLVPLYDEVVAVLRPMVRRSLTWHYRDFSPLEEQQALALLHDSDR